MGADNHIDLLLILLVQGKLVILRTHTCCRTLENISMAILDSDILKSLHGDAASRMNQPSDLVLRGRQTHEALVYDRFNLYYLIPK